MASGNDKKDTLKSLGGAGILGLLGYSAMRSNIVENAFDSAEKLNGLTMGGGRTNELRDAGETLRSGVLDLKEATDRLRRESLESLRENFLNKIEAYLQEGEAKSVSEKKAFFAALFDSMKEEQLAVGDSGQIEDIIRKAYDSFGMDDVTKADFQARGLPLPSLNDSDRQILTEFFQNTFSNEESLERFGKAHQKYERNIEQFATRSRRNSFGTLRNQQQFETFSSIEDFLTNNKAYDQTTQKQIRNRFERLNAKMGSNVEAISFKAISEGDAIGVKSLYARVQFSGNRVLNIPLYLGKDETGNVIFRATENLSSRYVAPLNVIRADAILDVTSMTSTRFRSLKEAKAGGAVVDFTTYMFDDILNNLSTQDILNMSQRRINEITAYERNFGLDAPRTMTGYGSFFPDREATRNVSRNLQAGLHASRNFQASNAIVAGIENFDRKNQRDVVKRLLQFYEGEMVGVNASQTMTMRYENPYTPYGVTKLFGQIGLRLSGEDLTPFDAVKTLGLKDRVLLPQTARESQLFGRYEAIEGLRGIETFGRSNLPTVSLAETGELIGVSKKARSTVGMNLAGFLVKERAVSKLGLAEGVSYFGGEIMTTTSMPKTVVESGIANTRLMEDLIERFEQTGAGFVVGEREGADMTVDEFFKRYGDREGRAILGHLDADFAQIKRRGGLLGFDIGLSDFSREAGRNRYHLVGSMTNLNTNSKLFSYLVKDTTQYVDEATISRKLTEVLGDAEAKVVQGTYYSGMGGKIGNTLLSSSAQLKKSVYNISVGMVGALSMIDTFGSGLLIGGTQQDVFDFALSKKLEGQGYLNTVNKIYNKTYTSLDNVTYQERTGAYLYSTVDTILDLARGGRNKVDQGTLGYILGGVEEYHESFGLKKNQLVGLYEQHGLDLKESGAFMSAYRSNVILAAGYSTTGGVHAELGRNLARVEPRFMNYLYTNLKTNLGFNAKDATEYLSSMLIRQGGIESKSTATLGMYLGMMSLSSLPGSEFTKELQRLGGITKMDADDITQLKTFGQGRERALSEFLSRRDKGQILDFRDLISDKARLKKISERLGGRTEIFLPGAETLENFEGFKIRGAGETIKIEGEYNRYLTDLVSSINAMSAEKDDELFDRSLKSFESSKKYLSTVVGTAVRQSLSGTLLGSGSYMGGGFRFGTTADAGYEFDTDVSVRNRMRAGFLDAFNRSEGYVIFQDAQSFLDGMTTYKEALKKELRVRGFDGRKLSENEIHQMSKGLTGERLKEFFFSIIDSDVEAPTVTAQRNPFISYQHAIAAIRTMRYDFAKGNQDAMFKYLKEYRGTFFNEEGMAKYREEKKSIVRSKISKQQGIKLFNETKYNEFLEKRKEVKTKIDQIKTLLYGAPIEVEGQRKMETVLVEQEDGTIKNVLRTQRDKGTVSAEVLEGEQRIRGVHEERVRLKEEINQLKGGDSALTSAQEATAKKIEADKAFNQRVQTPVVEESYVHAASRGSRTNRRALQNKIDKALARAKSNYQSSQELSNVLKEIQDAIERYKNALGNAETTTTYTPEDAKKIQSRIAFYKKELRELQSLANRSKLMIAGKQQFEAGTVKGFSLNRFSSISFEDAQVSTGGGKTRKVGPGMYLGRLDFTPAKGNEARAGEVKYFEFWRGERVDIDAAHKELIAQKKGSGLKDLHVLREARELNIIQKASQVFKVEDEIKSISQRLVSDEQDLFVAKRELKRFENLADPTEADLNRAINAEEDIDFYKKRIEKLEARKTQLVEKEPKLKESLKLLVEAEGESKLTMNRVVAQEAVLNRFERNAVDSSGNFMPGFMEEVRGFYGQYDANSGMSRREFLTENREVAKKAFAKQVDEQVGAGKKYSSLTNMTMRLLGISDNMQFQEIERSVFDKETGEYVTKKSKYYITPDEAEVLKKEIATLDDLQGARADLFDPQAIADAQENNEYYRLKQELIKENESLAALEKQDPDFVKLSDFEKQQMSLEYDERIGLSDLENEELRARLSTPEYSGKFEDLAPKEQTRLIEEKKVINRLGNLEDALGLKRGSIENFEDLRAATKKDADMPFTYERYDIGKGEKVTVQTTVNEEVEKLMMGVLNTHIEKGGHGSGLVYFPEINITATLKNTASGKEMAYDGRMDLSRFLIGDFDADIYQIFHDTNKILRNKFNKGVENFHGFYQAGGEYLFNMGILGEGMLNFSNRIGTLGMNAEQFILDQYSKEKILKDVGPIDVQVKAGMFSFIQNATEAAVKGGDLAESMRHTRAAAALISVAQEVLVIKSKKLPVAAGIADNFLKSMQSAFSTGSADQLINFFEANVFKGGVFEGGGTIEVSDVVFKDLPEGRAATAIRNALESIQMGKAQFEESLHQMARTGNKLNILSMMSDRRTQEVMRTANLTTTRQLRQLMALSMEGGLIDTDAKTFNYDVLEQAFKNAQASFGASNVGLSSARGLTGLALGALGASYLVGSSVSTNKLDIEDKFSDMRTRSVEKTPFIMGNKDHQNSGAAISSMGQGESFYQTPINTGESYVTNSFAGRLYGEAPTYHQAQAIARQFTSVGGEAFLAVQDNRRPISNSYITKSLKD